MTRKYRSFREFYPYYLSEHADSTCRRLHFLGTALVILLFFYAVFSGSFLLLLVLPICGYGFAWVGHFFFEKNKPATFQYPLYSLMGDFVMFKDMLMGRVSF
ncbi:DUF962 domain-containing protein [Luteithermobacter gelatinilyticus]|uniref:DUF962 domain-containing protein n=1 Tax=Luteithermobacter gelatinilyticus TaxID=2582913 RepID=UPI00110579C6|nr:DUF962 domain-containing protein [Luteithermobacter gelatinilyticus]|tara:strand:- start:2631 stop:2936 length:306 start_codon:yes stop_codon:yes gene_type:complete